MAPQLFGERFEVLELAGAGGMGVVYRALDRRTGVIVALKVLARTDPASGERFEKEARILAELDHPRIVRYVGHGRTAAAQWIAMEWLDGETLADRLVGGPLGVAGSLELMLAVCDALALVHARGMVHRDIKPTNLFLVGKELEGVKILDFGIARHGRVGTATSTGAVVGTPGYVAPEQALGVHGLDGRADVFALGAVLYECLTGRPAFVGGNVMAVLAKILLEEAPRVAGVPAAVAALVARLLAKNPAQRPRDAAALADEIARLSVEGVEEAPEPPPALTAGEQRLISVILTTLAPPAATSAVDGPATVPMAPGELAGPPAAPPEEVAHAATVPSEPALTDTGAELRSAALEYGGQLEVLADHSVLATLRGGVATDLAARAARCALALRKHVNDAPIALATGRGMIALRYPVGEVIDDAAALVRALHAEGRRRTIRIDATTAGLLDARFELGGDGHGLELVGERGDLAAPRTLLGRPSPFVGRERELGALLAIYDECAAEPLARPVLVTGAAGAGKSRLVQELVARLGARDAPPELWIARGDAIRAGAPFGMLAPALRRAAGILDGEPLDVRRQKLRARIGRHVPEAQAGRVAEFIGELIGTRFPDEDSDLLRSARRDLLAMGDQMRLAFEQWVVAECRGPLVLVLDDLHWGDLPTVKFVDGALREAAGRPFLVVALARPEVHGSFPQLWAERGVQEVRLGGLGRRASEKLVRSVLTAADADTVTGLVERAAGNALFLEELIRAVAEHRTELPATVLAMVGARLEELEPEARRVLRAASVFGETFWRGGVATLLGGDADLDRWLDDLCAREIAVRRPGGRFPSEPELAFGHGLVRDAAYGLLTEDDRVLGHRLAGEWLERAGEPDAAVLAEHFEAGQARERAVGFYARAAEQALRGNDFAAAAARAERGVACGAAGEARGELLALRAEAQNRLGELAAAEQAAEEALRLLPRGVAAWFDAVGQLAVAGLRTGSLGRLVTLFEEAAACPVRESDAVAAQVQALARIAANLTFGGRRDAAARVLEEIAHIEAFTPTTDPAVMGHVAAARATFALYGGELALAHALARRAAELHAAAGAVGSGQRVRVVGAFACLEAGAYAEAVAELGAVAAEGQSVGTRNSVTTAISLQGAALARSGKVDEAIPLLRRALDEAQRQGDRRVEGAARAYLAAALHARGELEAAAAEAQRAAELLRAASPVFGLALATLAQVRLAQGDVAGARAVAVQARAVLDKLGALEEGEGAVWLADAMTRHAAGDLDGARQVIAAARYRLHARAEKLGAWRAGFLAIPEHARTLRLADEWLRS